MFVYHTHVETLISKRAYHREGEVAIYDELYCNTFNYVEMLQDED